MGLLDELLTEGKKYLRDAMPGGLLNPEISNQSVLDGAAIASSPVPVIGDLLGLGADLHRYAKQPEERTAGNFALTGLGMLPFIPSMTAWHGSPHKFDKFDSSKIGTGEGAQAYGHGLYLAESPDVAKSYQSALSADRGFSFGGKTGLTRAEVQDMVNAKYGAGYLDGVIRPSGVADSFIDDMVTGTGRASGAYPRQYKPGSERAKLYDELRGQVTHADPGSLYKVDLPDDQIARMLDWDKPLSQQPEAVRVALKDFGLPPTATGKDAYNALSQQARDMAIMRGQNAQTTLGASQAGASNDLLGFGIPGIRYLDGGSRSAGQGSSNFVAFDPEMIRILERNGQATGNKPWQPGEYKLGDLLK